MRRREFLKLVGALAATAMVPLEWQGTTVELEPVINGALLEKAMSIGAITKAGVTVNLDTEKMWQAVHLVDQWGHEWRTPDQGQTWAWDKHWFNAEGECSWA